jgi:hypothetical protein
MSLRLRSSGPSSVEPPLTVLDALGRIEHSDDLVRMQNDRRTLRFGSRGVLTSALRAGDDGSLRHRRSGEL